MRIAVHPDIQSKGVGSEFVDKICQQAEREGVEFVGSSFGANASLVNFWHQSSFALARLGFTRDKSSGEHSALMLKPMTLAAERFFKQIHTNFYKQFLYLLTLEYADLQCKLVWQILHRMPLEYVPALTKSDRQAVEDFTSKRRQLSPCSYGLRHWLIHHCQHDYHNDMAPLIARLLQRKAIEDIATAFDFTGRKAVITAFINYIEEQAE